MFNQIWKLFKSFLTSDKIVWVIFLFALILRTYHLSSVPSGFHRDEVANTYIGRFIFENGQDIYGNKWPIFYVNKFGDYPPVVPMYLAGLSTYLWGINDFAARFPAALIGSLAVFPLYYLLRLLISSKFALISAVILAILPWHVSLSRASSEGVIGFTVSLWAMLWLFQGIYTHNFKKILCSWPLFLLTYLLYPSFRLVIPLVILPLPFIYSQNKLIKKYLIASLVIVCFCTLLISLTVWGRGRFGQTSLFSNPTDAGIISNDIQGLIFDDQQTSIFVVRIFHNKVVGYGQRLIEQYFYYLSPMFWFMKGGAPDRYSIPHVGLIFLSLGVFLFGYLFPSKLKNDPKIVYYFLYLFLATVVPVAITVEDTPNIHRSIFLTLPVVFFLTLGLLRSWDQLKKVKIKNLIISIFLVVFVADLIYSGHEYFQHAGSRQSYLRDDGSEEMALYLKDQTNQFSKIIAPQVDWLPIYYLYFAQDFAKRYIGQFSSDFMIKNIGKIEFMDNKCPSHQFPEFNQPFDVKTTLIIDQGDCEFLPWYKVRASIARRDGTIAFKVLEVK